MRSALTTIITILIVMIIALDPPTLPRTSMPPWEGRDEQVQHSTEQGPHLEPSSPHPTASQIQLQPRAPPVPLRTSHGRREAQQEKETGKQCQEREQVSVMSRGAVAAPSRAVSEARPDRDSGRCPCYGSSGAGWALGSFPPEPLHNPMLRMFPSCAPWAPALLSAEKSFTHPKKGAKQPLQGRMSSRFPECSGVTQLLRI